METQAEINEFLMACYQDDDPNTFHKGIKA
jgi:hypothetical protein